ncbi:hypothetical protein PNEG_00017 [Pneumocystis murina B123]|uniref:Pheromone-regulated membrane protein 10 n=1 Tax=Pneumocystis murina (strain B123) TaxID=1069680 RepID=M7NS41_PNEMU|nr:hypothetical protein PNEG_00017 [Pneumocystis murina B123]EMR11573.1 hypothetical protein PNEG_00017 [Pneumocystis murina B123]
MSEQAGNTSSDAGDIPDESCAEDLSKRRQKRNIHRVRFDAKEDLENMESVIIKESTHISEEATQSSSSQRHKRVSSFYIQEEVETSALDSKEHLALPGETESSPLSPVLDSFESSQRLGISPLSLYTSQLLESQQTKIPSVQLLDPPHRVSSSPFLSGESPSTFSVPEEFEQCVPKPSNKQASAASSKKKTGKKRGREIYSLTKYAYDLVRSHLRGESYRQKKILKGSDISDDSTRIPGEDTTQASGFRGGVLSHLLKLYNSDNIHFNRQNINITPPGTGRSTPKWHSKSTNSSSTSLSALLATSSATVALPGLLNIHRDDSGSGLSKSSRPPYKLRKHSSGLANAIKHSLSRSRLEDEIRITIHLADVLQRQKFILRLCHALMLYGSPTHRLEECMKLTSRVLEIDGQFLYIPGCMIISFGDLITHTSDMHVVRVNQGLDIGKLQETHFIYKQVIHDLIGVEEAMKNLDEVINRKQYYKNWVVILFYGFASALVGPFAFNASWFDMPISFLLGTILGLLRVVVTPRSFMYANAFEISATIITSFLARAFGSIPDRKNQGKYIFCFASMAESSIALILPGYLVLCGSLELQTKNIVAGSVRLFYAIIYSLFLGFGITIGSVIYGSMDRKASNETYCQSNIDILYRFISVPIFTACILVVNQAKPQQFPVAVIIAGAGYIVNFFSSKRFGASQVSNAIGAFVIGCLGNIYSRIGHDLAFTVVLPAIFVQIPSGLAAQRGVYIGIGESNEIFAHNSSTDYNISNVGVEHSSSPNSLSFGIVMIQIAIAITVGLFFSSILIYSFGGMRKRSALFSL